MAIKYVNHTIQKSVYNGFDSAEDINEIPINIHGSIAVSKNMNPGVINVLYIFTIGGINSEPVMQVVTETIFEYSDTDDSGENKVRNECLPVAINKTKTDVNNLMTDYGLENIHLPDGIWSY